MQKNVYEQLIQIRAKLDNLDKWMSLSEVCEYTCLSESTIRRLIIKGELKVSKKTGKNLFRKSWLDSFLGGQNA